MDDAHNTISDGDGIVIAVISPKGGVGKTTVAANLAARLCATRSGAPPAVALVDFDLGSGTAAAALGVQPPRTLADLAVPHTTTSVAESPPASSQVARAVCLPAGPGLTLAASPADPVLAEQIPAPRCAQVAHYLRAGHEFVVIDTPSGFGEVTLTAIDLAQLVIVPVSGDAATVGLSGAALRTLHLLGVPADRVVAIASRDGIRHDFSADEISAALGSAVRASLPEHDDVRLARRRGRLLAKDWPSHPYCQALDALIVDIFPHVAMAEPAAAGRWSRLVGSR